MKLVWIHLVIAALLVQGARAEYRTWTRNDGKTAELELTSVREAEGEKIGEFRMRNGRTVSLKASLLTMADAELLAEWKPPSPGGEAAKATPDKAANASVFDKVLDGELLRLQGRALKSCSDARRPKKYYLFYYTASWCGPCRQYTPTLVDFYNRNKNDNYEIVLITADQESKAMEGYAKELRMPWPQLKLASVGKFQREFPHGVTGIPSVVACDLTGKIVSRSRSIPELEQLVK